MEIFDENQPASIPSSPISDLTSSDSDAYNTASARIHFGPLRSPEKKFVPITDRRKTLQPISPLRRSPRLSTPVPGSPIMSAEETDENGDGNEVDGPGYRSRDRSRSGTPENDIFPQDEPSSVLATKIIRAHDNPSPPPHAHDRPGTISSHIVEFDTPEPLNIPFAINAFIANRENEIYLPPELGPALCTEEPTSPALPLHATSPSPSVESKSNASQHDLISFDSFCAPLPTADIPTPDALLALRTSSTTATRTDRTSIDDILSRYPTTSPVPEVTVTINDPPSPTPLDAEVSNKDNVDPADIADEQAIENTLTFPEVECFSRSTSPFPIILPPNLREGGGDEPPQTPIRRSSRSRNGTPYNLTTYNPNIAVEGIPAFFTQNQPQTPPRQPRLLAPPPSAQTQRKRRKGKERAVSPSNELANDLQSAESRSRSASAEPSWRTKRSVDMNSQEADMEGLNGRESGKKGKRREDGKTEKAGKEAGRHALTRDLGSLSPDSATLLTQLVPSTKTSPVFQEADTWEEPTTPQPSAFLFSVFPQRQEATFVIQKAPAPENAVRFTSPVRFAPSHSSPKARSAPISDPDRTPARRIPIEQAIAQGQISPQKAVHFNAHGMTPSSIMRTPVFTRPTDTPARRVPISDTTPVKTQGSKQASPVRGSRGRSGSVALKPFGAGNGKGRSGSVEQQERRQKPWGAGNGLHVRPQTATPRSGSGSKLPFPIVPTHDPPNSIPEEHEGAPVPPDVDNPARDGTTASASNASAAKSSLRQPSAGSRIPRIGIKPYARPAVATSMEIGQEREKSTVPRIVDLRVTVNPAHASKPFRLVGSGSGNSSEDVAKNLLPANPNAAFRAMAPTDVSAIANLKRKRATEPLSPVKQAHPTVLTWQASHNAKQTSGVVTPLKTNPVKKAQELVSLGHVVDRDPGVPIGTKVIPVPSNGIKEADTAEVPVIKRQQIEGGDPASVELKPSSSTVHEIPSAPSRIPSDKGSNSGTSLPSESNSGYIGKVRRTTRLRKPAQPSSAVDVFGTTDVRPLQPRRKVPTHLSTQSETGAFPGMSAVALKALTSTNTTRNQKYLATTLETEIIRKEGDRPESPTVKVRTFLQRQKEEKGKQRMERAARRARRSEDGSGLSDTDGQSDPVDSSLADVDSPRADDGQNDQGGYRRKHRRGPGDEEDYESPYKPERPAKRLKFEEEGEENARVEKRRVKWDRGLSTTIYLDEVQPGTRARPKENVNAKGCLAKTAKALRLDTLGNIPNADTPLVDLVHENVIVKKFVYDNDAELPAEEVYVVRGTRSRSKKVKT